MMFIINKIDQWTGHIMIRPKLLIAFYLISFLPILIVSTFFYLNSSKILKEELGTYMVETSRQVDLSLDSFISNMEYLSTSISYNPDVQRFLTIEDMNMDDSVSVKLDLYDLLETTIEYRDNLWSAFLVNDDRNVLFYSEADVNPVFSSWWVGTEVNDHFLIEDPIYKQIINEKEFRLYPPHSSRYTNGETVVTFGGRLYRQNNERGTLLFNFNPQVLYEMSDSVQLGDTGYVTIISEIGEPLFDHHNISDSILESLSALDIYNRESGYDIVNIKGVETLISFSSSEKTGWKIVSVVPFHELSGKITSLRTSIYIISFIAILLVLLFSKYLSQLITSPLVQIKSYMKEAESGDLSIRVPVKRKDEYGKLALTFNHMLERLEQLKDKIHMSEIREIKLRLLHRESELKALQMQINPHFLYNTLNTMKCIGDVMEVKEVANMSESLAEMFKYSIDHEKYKTLKKEVSHVKAYLQIIQIRFPEKVQCHFDIPAALQDTPMLKLILQPLVENAVEHGIIPKGTDGIIKISARVEDGGHLVIRIIDDGAGITEDKLLEINNKLASDDKEMPEDRFSNSIGLSNVHQRLQLTYGEKSKLYITSKPNKGTRIEISLPVHPSERGEE